MADELKDKAKVRTIQKIVDKKTINRIQRKAG